MLDFQDFCIAFGCLVKDDGEGNPDMETNILAADNRALVMEEKDLQQQLLVNNHLFEKQTAALNKRVSEMEVLLYRKLLQSSSHLPSLHERSRSCARSA